MVILNITAYFKILNRYIDEYFFSLIIILYLKIIKKYLYKQFKSNNNNKILDNIGDK